MKKGLLIASVVLSLQACGVIMPNVSSNVIEATPQGSLINIHATYCGHNCTELAMKKAQEVCPKGFIVRNTTQGGTYTHNPDVSMIIRCEN